MPNHMTSHAEVAGTAFRSGFSRSRYRRYSRFTFANMQTWSLYLLVMLWIARNTILMRRRPGEMYTALDTMALLQMALVVLILIVLLSGPLFKLLPRIWNSSTKFYFLYYFLAMISALWSPSAEFSLYRAVEVIALSMAVLVFCTAGANWDENMRRGRILIWSVVAMLAISTAYHGSILNLRNNTLGAASAMTACFFISWILAAGRDQKDRKRMIQGMIGTALVFLSLSLASWWAFWFGICYCALFSRRKWLIVMLFLIGTILFFSLGTDTRENLLVRDKTPDQIETMRGRKLLWQDYWELSEQRPILGFGFAVGAREIGSIYTTNAHNMFFGSLIGLGWIGVSCWILFFAALGTELIRYRHSLRPAWLACAAALAAGAMNSMSLSILGEQWNVSTTVFVAFLGLHMCFVQQERLALRVKREKYFLARALKNARRTYRNPPAGLRGLPAD